MSMKIVPGVGVAVSLVTAVQVTFARVTPVRAAVTPIGVAIRMAEDATAWYGVAG